MVTGRPSISRKIPMKSPFWYGSNLARAARLCSLVSERIISRMARILSSAKNMCSVRHSPIPSAPKTRACLASCGVSALVRIFKARNSSAHSINFPKLPVSSGFTRATCPSMTSPVDPFRVIQSPSEIVRSPQVIFLSFSLIMRVPQPAQQVPVWQRQPRDCHATSAGKDTSCSTCHNILGEVSVLASTPSPPEFHSSAFSKNYAICGLAWASP